MSEIFKHVRIWVLEYVRGLYPIIVCFVGGLVLMVAGETNAVVAMIVAGIAFVWALDLAATSAAAKARESTAALLTSMLVSGGDTTVTIDINHNTPPQTERNEG